MLMTLTLYAAAASRSEINFLDLSTARGDGKYFYSYNLNYFCKLSQPVSLMSVAEISWTFIIYGSLVSRKNYVT